MRRIANLVPTVGDLDRNKAKIAGFVVGVFVPLLIVALFTVIYTGYGFGETPVVRPPIYPNF